MFKKLSQKFAAKCAATKQTFVSTIKDKKGEMFLDKAVWIIAIIVIGALILGLMYTLIGDTVMGTVTDKVTELFDYAG